MRLKLDAIPGVNVSLIIYNSKLDVEEDGRVVQDFAAKDSATLRVEIDAGLPFRALDVNGGRNRKEVTLQIKRDQAYRYGLSCRVFEKRITIQGPSQDGLIFTSAPNNHFLLVELREHGAFRIYEVAFVGYQNMFWLTLTRRYESCCYVNGDGQIHCKQFEEWTELKAKLSTMFQELGISLPDHDDAPTDEPPSCEGLLPGQARGYYYSPAKGWGLAVYHDGAVVNCYWKNFRKSDKLPCFSPGQLITCRVREIKKAPIDPEVDPAVAPRQTSLDYEAYDIRPLED